MKQTTMAGPLGLSVPYAKMNGIGNSILVVDLRGGGSLDGDQARRLGEREGFGFDQLMAIAAPRSSDADATVEIYNRDGSRVGACGNGTRCVAWFMLRGADRIDLEVESAAGLLHCRRNPDGGFTVDMGRPRFGWHEIPLRDAVEDTRAVALHPASKWIEALGPAAMVNMGNPHAVFFLDPSSVLPNLGALGPALEHHPMFPERANISFARVVAPNRILLDVWERGAGLTRACGSAACAALVAAARTGLAGRKAEVVLPGGTLAIEWRDEDDHVLMTGPVELEHEGVLTIGVPA